jgi:7-carboxy-7-deazaguanine synthase
MFGLNPIRKLDTDPGQLAVEDVFYTIQGEGPYGGCPALFIRLAGCNLACHFCDTQFETKADSPRSVAELIDDIKARFPSKQRRLVVITGGEPMRQNWSRLAAWLLATGTEVIQIETAGTVWQMDLTQFLPKLVIVCSPKTPSVNPVIATHCRHWKYIIRHGEVDGAGDGLPNRGTQSNNKGAIQRLYRPGEFEGQHIWVSPCDEYDEAANKANLELTRDLALKHGYRVSLQTHKILGVA